MHRRDIFDVSGKRYKSFLKTLSTKKISFVRKKLTKNLEKVDFWGVIPLDCLISPKIICFNALKIRLSFVKKKKKWKS